MSQPVDRKRLREEIASPSTSRPTMWRSIWKRVNYTGGDGVAALKQPSQRKMLTPSPCYDIDDDDDSSSSSDMSFSSSTSDDDEYYECQSSSSGDYYDASDRSFSPEFDMDDLNKTHFPDFHLENIPDGELTDTSDTESNQEEKQRKYTTKEDQDVAVFLTLAKRMTFKSLLHLLQGHVKALNPSPEYLQTYKAATEDYQIRSSQAKSRPGRKGSLIKKKQFRWAELSNEQVRVVVHPIESYKDQKDLWWRQHEMNSIRSDLIETVHFFRKHRHEYMNSVEVVAKGELSELVIESHMKKLIDDSYARGLETHIVQFLSDHRKSHVSSVVQEYMECKESGDDYEMTSHCLRSQSLAYSQLTTDFATRIAKCDEIDALKAKMSKWPQLSQPKGTAGFITR